jgi:hypothetical protein
VPKRRSRRVGHGRWSTPRAHLDEDETVEMARAAVPLLADKPDLDLYETVSAHDLA